MAKCDPAANYSLALLLILAMPDTFPLLMNARNYFYSSTNEDPSANTPPACVGSCGRGLVVLSRDFFHINMQTDSSPQKLTNGQCSLPGLGIRPSPAAVEFLPPASRGLELNLLSVELRKQQPVPWNGVRRKLLQWLESSCEYKWTGTYKSYWPFNMAWNRNLPLKRAGRKEL